MTPAEERAVLERCAKLCREVEKHPDAPYTTTLQSYNKAARDCAAAIRALPLESTEQVGVLVSRDFLASLRPALKAYETRTAQSVLKWERGEYPAHYEKMLKEDAALQSRLLKTIDSLIGDFAKDEQT